MPRQSNSVAPTDVQSNRHAPHDIRTSALNISRQSAQVSDAGRVVRLSSGVNLDLTSSTRTITLGKNLFSENSDSIAITVGGESKTVSAGAAVTPAEYVAVKQALSGGQKISLDLSGKAVGGEVDLGAITANNDVMRATDLVVAANVTTYGDFGRHSDFRLQGDLNNYGTVNALSSDTRINSGSIHADDITNHAGSLINSSVDLTLAAAGNFVNQGTIVSDGGLTVSAGATLRNSGSVNAAGKLLLNSSAINNSGLLKSSGGDVHLEGAELAALTVNNAGGTISALNGAINVRSADYGGTYNSTVTGGDLLSRELNLNSARGLASVEVNKLTGTINGTGTAAHVLASTDMLNLGNVCLTGDPTFYNTTGGINISANLSVAEKLTLVASGNITSADSITVQAGDASRGYDITFVAGADFTANGGSDSPTVPPGTAGGVSLSGKASKTGGGILLGDGVNLVARSTDATGADDGGNFVFAAFAGKNDGSGVVDLGGDSVSSGGKNGGVDGNVYIYAGAKGDAVRVGAIDTTGGVDGVDPGIAIFTIQPSSSIKGQPIVFDQFGARTSTAEFGLANKITKGANIFFGNFGVGADVNTTGNTLFNAGGNIEVAGDLVTSGLFDFRGANGISMDPLVNPIVASSRIKFSGNTGNIGTQSTPLRIDTPRFSAGTFGEQIAINIVTAGAVVTDFIEAKDFIVVNAPNATLSSINDISSGTDITLNVFRFGNYSISGAGHSITLNTTDPTYKLTGAFSFVPIFNASSVGGIGTVGNAFEVEGISEINVTGPDIYLSQISTKKSTYNLEATNHAEVVSDGSMFIDTATVTAGDFDAASLSGTLSVNNIQAFSAIDIVNTGSKGKIAFVTDAVVATSAKSAVPGVGAISISTGPLGAPLTSPIANVNEVETGGLVTFRGSGVKASSPVNTVTALGADVTINNGFKSTYITFGGNVKITADPPVAAGTPTFITVGPERISGISVVVTGTSSVVSPAVSVALSEASLGSFASYPTLVDSAQSALSRITIANMINAVVNPKKKVVATTMR